MNTEIKNRIFNLLDRIEDLTGHMAHEIAEIAEPLRDWQDGKVRDLTFYNFLTNYKDGLL